MHVEKFAMTGVECHKIMDQKPLKMRRGDIVTRVRGNLRAVSWRDRRDVYILTHIHTPPLKDNFTDEPCHVFKPRVVD
jgi:hypothetical protein